MLIDKGIMLGSKNRKTNLAIEWVGYNKAYNMVPHSWIRQVLEVLKTVKNIKRLIVNSTKNRSTQLETLDGQELGKVQTKRCIFQGVSLSPLLFVMALISLAVLLKKVKSG